MFVKIWHWSQHFAACETTVFVVKYMSIMGGGTFLKVGGTNPSQKM